MSRHGECTVYVGDLGNDASKPELEYAFSYYGPLRNVWIAKNPPGFAFVEFEDPHDAENAIRGLDGTALCGRRARVELSNSRGHGRRPPPRPRFPPRPCESRCYHCGDRGHYARNCVYRRHLIQCGSGRRTRSRSLRRTRSRSLRRTRSRSLRRTRSRSLRRTRSRSVHRSRSSSRRYSSACSRSPRASSRSYSLSRTRSRSFSRNGSTPGSKSRSRSQEYKKGG